MEEISELKKLLDIMLTQKNELQDNIYNERDFKLELENEDRLDHFMA